VSAVADIRGEKIPKRAHDSIEDFIVWWLIELVVSRVSSGISVKFWGRPEMV